MSIAPSLRRSGAYLASQGQTAFPLDWPPLGLAVRVTRTRGGVASILPPTSYVVTDAPGGGLVTLTVAAQAGDTYLIEGSGEVSRPSAFSPFTPLSSGQLDAEFDRLTALMQERTREGGQALRVAGPEFLAPLRASPLERAGKVLAFDDTGAPMLAVGLAGVPAGAFGASLVAAADRTAARGSLQIIDPRRAPERFEPRRRAHPTYAFINPLAMMPGSLGAGIALQDANGNAALTEAWIRFVVKRILVDYQIPVIVIGQAAFGPFGFVKPTGTDTWPAPVDAEPQVDWYKTLAPQPGVQDLDIYGIILNEASKHGGRVIAGLSRQQDLYLINDVMLKIVLGQPDPMVAGLTVEQRAARWAAAERKLARWIIQRYGHEPSLAGWYEPQEPDGLQALGWLYALLHSPGGADPPIKSYRTASCEPFQLWTSPASPIDLRFPDQAVLRAAIVASQVDVICEQDTMGTAADRITGVPQGPAGAASVMAQLYADHLIYEELLAGTGVIAGAHMELWRHANWVAYNSPFPAAAADLDAQWRANAAVLPWTGLYELISCVHSPEAPLQPPVSLPWCADYRARAHANDAWLLARARNVFSGRVLPRQMPGMNHHQLTWNSLGGIATIDLPTYRPRAEASELMVSAFVHFSRAGNPGAAAGWADVSLIVDGVEQLPRIRTTQNDTTRSASVTVNARLRLIGTPRTLQLRVENMQIAPNVAVANARIQYIEVS